MILMGGLRVMFGLIGIMRVRLLVLSVGWGLLMGFCVRRLKWCGFLWFWSLVVWFGLWTFKVLRDIVFSLWAARVERL